MNPASAQSVEPVRVVRSLAEIRFEGVVRQQWDKSCGAAALATLLSYDLDDPVSERAVAASMLHGLDPARVRGRGGFSLLNMKQYAERRGYEADGYGNMTTAHLAGMVPSIVSIRLHGYDHFVVVRRIEDGMVDFADPAFGKRRMSLERFEQAWSPKVAFVVRRPK